MASTRHVVVLGLGRFGGSLAAALQERGVDVLAIDNSPETVQSLADELAYVVRADTTDADALSQLDVQSRDIAVVAMTDVQASLLTLTVLTELGVPEIWAKAKDLQHARVLRRLGAHHVVQPERDLGLRVSHMLVAGHMQDYIEFEDGFSFAKTDVPSDAVGKPLGESTIRSKYGITVVAVKRAGADFEYATEKTVPHRGDTLIVSGKTALVERFAESS
ncbi:MAG: TrkA family potassium uptake protein [Micrococcales bacterium]|nr:TrkA family potassium uptake protein [Micrococcales bacterium]